MKKLIMVASLLSLTACAGMNYAIENYTGVKPKTFAHDDKTFRVFDKPNEGRLMITPSLGDAAGAGMVQGLTLGLSGNMSGPEGKFQKATETYLRITGRKCRITNGALVVQPQWEFFYTCS